MLEVKASIKLYTKGLSLKDVSDKLKYNADFGYSEGDCLYRKPNEYYEETMWGKNSTVVTDKEIDAHLVELLDFIDGVAAEFTMLSGKTDTKSEISCVFSSDNGQGGAQINSETIKRLASYDLDLVFDVYMDDE